MPEDTTDIAHRSARPGRGVYIGRYFRIEFYLDYSWFIIAALLVFALSSSFPQLLPGRAPAVYVAMALVAAALFFLSILLHELGHSLVSQRWGIPVPRITLLFIGGLAEISREPDNAKSELQIAAAGPAVSLLLALFFGIAGWLSSLAGFAEGAQVLSWLAIINVILVAFNAIPGYPLDGGRILRAILWARSGNLRKATLISSRIGIAVSYALMGVGIFCLFRGLYINAFMLFFIGMFLKSAAESGYSQAVFREVLDGVIVADIMTREPACIPDSMPLNLVVDDFFLSTHHIAFPVCDEDREFRGLLRLEHLKEYPREKWPYTTAGDLVAGQGIHPMSVPAEAPAGKVMRDLLTPGRGRLAVLENGRVAGIVTRHDFLQFIRVHSELDDEMQK